MRPKLATLQHISNDRAISKETDYEFWNLMEQAILLALRERGILSAMEYRQAEENQMKQRRNRAKRFTERGSQ